MTLIYHEMGHSDDKLKAGIGVSIYLQEGIYSRNKYRELGRLETKSVFEEWTLHRNAYIRDKFQRHIQYLERWRAGRRKALADNPLLLKNVLLHHEPKFKPHFPELDPFDIPNTYGNRDECVFFGCSSKRTAGRDWVAIDVPNTTLVHDARCRDEHNYERWINTSMSIERFIKNYDMQGIPEGWHSQYNEVVIKDHVPANRVVAYAKVEKTIPITNELTPDEIYKVQKELYNQLKFATQFESAEENILIYMNKLSGQYEIRVSFNKEKAQSNLDRITAVFQSLSSFEQLISQSELNDVDSCLREVNLTHGEIKHSRIPRTLSFFHDDSGTLISFHYQNCKLI